MGKFCKQNTAVTLFFFIILISLVPLVSGLACTQNSQCDIKHPVRVDGGIPQSTVICNITIQTHNFTEAPLIDFEEMTRADDGRYYNFTLNSTQTSTIGEYDYDVTCVSDNLNKTDPFSLFINPGGVEPSQSRTDAITRTIYIMFGISLVLFFAFLFSREGNVTFRYTYFLMSLLSLLIGVNILFISLQDDVVNSSIQGFFSFFTAASFYLYWFFGFLIGVLWIFTIINTVIFKQNEARMRRMGNLEGFDG